MINGEPEDELRRLIIAFYPADGEMAAFEVCNSFVSLSCVEVARRKLTSASSDLTCD